MISLKNKHNENILLKMLLNSCIISELPGNVITRIYKLCLMFKLYSLNNKNQNY